MPLRRRLWGIRGRIPKGFFLGRISPGEGDVELLTADEITGSTGLNVPTLPVDLTSEVTGTLPIGSGGTGGATAGDARTALGVDVAGTDNSTNVTLAGTPSYITIVGQVITRLLIDLGAVVTGVLPIANGGSNSSTAAGARTNFDVDQAGTDNSTDVTLAGTPAYITIVGQVITRLLIDLGAVVTGVLPIANGGTNASTASGARTELGLGTVATFNTGISGATIPILNTSVTWTGRQVISRTGGAQALELIRPEQGAATLSIKSEEDRAFFSIGSIDFTGHSDLGNDHQYATIQVSGVDVTDAAEHGSFAIRTARDGASASAGNQFIFQTQTSGNFYPVVRTQVNVELSGVIAESRWSAHNDAAQVVNYVAMFMSATNVADGAEAGSLTINTMLAGAQAARVTIGPGISGPGVTGGDKGNNTLNFGSLFQSGKAVLDIDSEVNSLIPATTETHDLGTKAKVWDTLWLGQDRRFRTFKIAILDDAVAIVPSQEDTDGWLFIDRLSSGRTAIITFDTVGGDAIEIMVQGSGNIFETTTGVLTGTTGTDGKMTVSVHSDNNIYIENRTGANPATVGLRMWD